MTTIDAQIQTNIGDLGRTFETYWKLSRLSRTDALSKLGRNFSFAASRRLKTIQIGKGEITQERIAALKAGGGLKISQRAKDLVAKRYGKKKQDAEHARLALVTGSAELAGRALEAAQELRLRESHRAFTTSSVRFRGDLKAMTYAKTRYGQTLGQAKPVSRGMESDEFHFIWGSSISKWSGMATTGLTKAKAKVQLNAALKDTRADMLVYIDRKHKEAARAAARTISRL